MYITAPPPPQQQQQLQNIFTISINTARRLREQIYVAGDLT